MAGGTFESILAEGWGVRLTTSPLSRSAAKGLFVPEPSLDLAPDAPTSLADLSDEVRKAKREEQAAVRKQPNRRNQGLLIVYTGKGKGKTTASLGLVMRAWGRGMRIIVLQFIKAKTGNWGERRAAKKMDIPMIGLGDGFTWMSKDIEADSALAAEGWRQCREAIESGDYDLIVLDELTYCLKYNWLNIDEVLQVFANRPKGLHIVVTGRDAPQALLAAADLVSEIADIKHPYRAGVRAQKGIEF